MSYFDKSSFFSEWRSLMCHSFGTITTKCSQCGREQEIPTRSRDHATKDDRPNRFEYFDNWRRLDDFYIEEIDPAMHAAYFDGIVLSVTSDGIVRPHHYTYEVDGKTPRCLVPRFGKDAYWVCEACKATLPAYILDRQQTPAPIGY